MTEERRDEIAESLETTPELLPFIPELLADIWVLGSSPDHIVDLLRSLELPRDSTRVLELGCGKGAVAITVAQQLGFRVYGIDLFEPFIREARKRAGKLGVDPLCRFACSDMHDTIRKARGFDVVVYAAVGGLLGTFDECVGKLRRCARPGGYMIIDDGFLSSEEKIKRPGYEHYVSHDETLRQLTAHGDALLREIIVPTEEMQKYNKRSTELIRQAAKGLSNRHPELAEAFTEYVEGQEQECEILETRITGTIWLLKRIESTVSMI